MFRTATTMAILGLTVATTGAVASAPASAGHPAERPAYSISIYQQGQDVAVAGDTLKLKGGVTPAAPGQKVRLQVKYRDHKRFQNLATGILSKNSKYKFKTDVETNRDRVYRVVMPNSASSTQVSDRLEVRIYQWVPLTRLGSGNGFTEGTASIGGQSYPDSIIRTSYSGPGDAIWYSPLDYRCVELEAVVGLTDESPAGQRPAEHPPVVVVDADARAGAAGERRPGWTLLAGHHLDHGQRRSRGPRLTQGAVPRLTGLRLAIASCPCAPSTAFCPAARWWSGSSSASRRGRSSS